MKANRKGNVTRHELDTIAKKPQRLARKAELKKWGDEADAIAKAKPEPDWGKYGMQFKNGKYGKKK